MHEHDAMIRRLYENILTPEGWSSTIDHLRKMTDSISGTLMVWDKVTNDVLIGESIGLDASIKEAYETHYVDQDPTKALIGNIAPGQWYLDERHYGRERIRHDDFYQDFMVSCGMSSIMCCPLLRTETIQTTLSFQAAIDRPLYGDNEVAALNPFLPHLVTAVRLRARYDDLARMAQLGQQVLDSIPRGVLVIDVHGKVMLANTAGENWLRDVQSPFARQAMVHQSRVGAQLVTLAARICGDTGIAVDSVTLEPLGGARSTRLIGMPLNDSHPLALTQNRRVGVVVIHEPDSGLTPTEDLLRHLFRLTSAECRLVAEMARHDSTAEIAEAIGVGVETIRSQIKSILAKTGAANQRALVRTMTELALLANRSPTLH